MKVIPVEPADFYQLGDVINFWASRVLQWQRIHLPLQETKRQRFHPWAGRLPRSRKWQPAPGFLPGESHGQRSLGAAVHGVTEM